MASLAGMVYDASGRLLAFAFMADRLPAASGARGQVIDAMATALAGADGAPATGRLRLPRPVNRRPQSGEPAPA